MADETKDEPKDKKAAAKEPVQIDDSEPSPIKTLSEFRKLTAAQKQAFREANGTVTNDPPAKK